MLRQLLVDMQQRTALRLADRDPAVVGRQLPPRWRRRVKLRSVTPQLLAGRVRPCDELADAAGGDELRRPVPLDVPARHYMAAPVLHDAEAVGQDRVRRV